MFKSAPAFLFTDFRWKTLLSVTIAGLDVALCQKVLIKMFYAIRIFTCAQGRLNIAIQVQKLLHKWAVLLLPLPVHIIEFVLTFNEIRGDIQTSVFGFRKSHDSSGQFTTLLNNTM